MMGYYFVKQDLPGLPAGRVERFLDLKAALLVSEGRIVPYDEKRHADAPGAESVPEAYRRPAGKCPTCGK